MKKAIQYSISVCGLSWLLFGVFYLAIGSKVNANGLLMTLVKTIYMLFPMITALILQCIKKEKISSTGLLSFRPKWSWLVAILVPVVIVFLSILTSSLIPGATLAYSAESMIEMRGLEAAQAEALRVQLTGVPPAAMLFTTFYSGILAGCTINALFAFGEEYGWRNYMVAALKGVSFWKSALLIGVVWGIWHLPLILLGHNYPTHPVAGVPMMCVFCILVGIIELYFVLKTKSVFVAAIIHGTINAIAAITFLFVQGGNDLTVGTTGLGGFIAAAIVIAGIWLYDRSHDKIMSGNL